MDATRTTPRSRDIFDGYNAPLADEDIEATLPSASAMYHDSVKATVPKKSVTISGGTSKIIPRTPVPRSIDILDAYKPVPPDLARPAAGRKVPTRPSNFAMGNTTTCTHNEDDDDIDFATMMRNSSVRRPQRDLERQRAQQAQKESGWAADDKRTFFFALAGTTMFTIAVLVVMLVVGYNNRGPFALDRPYNVHGP